MKLKNKNEKYLIKQILVEEYYTREGEVVYLNWKLQNGTIIKQLTPYQNIPYIKLYEEK